MPAATPLVTGSAITGRKSGSDPGAVPRGFGSTGKSFGVTLAGPPAGGLTTAPSPGGSTSETSRRPVAPRPDALFADGCA